MHAKCDYKWLNNWQFRMFIVLIGNRLNDVCLCVFVYVWSNCSVHCVSHHEMVQTVISKFKLFKGHGMYYCHHIFVNFPSLNNSQCNAIFFQIISELFVLDLFIFIIFGVNRNSISKGQKWLMVADSGKFYSSTDSPLTIDFENVFCVMNSSFDTFNSRCRCNLISLNFEMWLSSMPISGKQPPHRSIASYSIPPSPSNPIQSILLWVARFAATSAIVLLVQKLKGISNHLIVFGESSANQSPVFLMVFLRSCWRHASTNRNLEKKKRKT